MRPHMFSIIEGLANSLLYIHTLHGTLPTVLANPGLNLSKYTLILLDLSLLQV